MLQSQKSPDVFFLHLGERLRKTAGFSRNLSNLEALYGKLFNPVDVNIIAENIAQKAAFKAREETIKRLIAKAKEEAAATGQPAVTSPPKA